MVTLRVDEQFAAERFELALREGRVLGLPAFPSMTWKPGDDPPDIVVDLGSRVVGVELACVLEGNYAAGITRDRDALDRGERPPPTVWTPDPARVIEAVVTKKSKLYLARKKAIPDWLLLHDSKSRPGFYDQPVEGHEYFAERCAAALAASPFERVILQSRFRKEEQWSVLHVKHVAVACGPSRR